MTVMNNDNNHGIRATSYAVRVLLDFKRRIKIRARLRRTGRILVHREWAVVPRAKGERLLQMSVVVLGVKIFARRYQRPKYKVALLVDEFFGGWSTAIGGYGALTRKYFAKYVPSNDIAVDVLLDTSGGYCTQKQTVDGVDLYRLSSDPRERQIWLDKQAYNLFVSIEMTYPSFEIIGKYATETPVLYWIQDPRRVDIYEARMNTVGRFGEGSWRYMRDVAAWVKKRIASEKIAFISQGNCLTEISREMFEIPSSMPVGDLVNPIEIDSQYKLDVPSKENRVVFLGRLEVVKRVWIVCELAKAMPQYEFYVVGASGRDQAANAKTLEPYRNFDGSSKISNLHFTGHLDGDAKNEQLKKAKLLINTSIWEAIPVTWLESLSYGTLLIAPFDRDELAGRFGSVVGDVLGDGTRSEDLAKFVRAIDYWMTHDEERIATAEKAIQFIRERHTVERFTRDMRAAILATML